MTSITISEKLRQRIEKCTNNNISFDAFLEKILDHYEHCPYSE